MNRYKCLCLDHDDTVVNSTATIHYPSFVEFMKIYRPALADRYSLDDYFRLNFDPGIMGLFLDVIGLSEQEMREEEAFWAEYVRGHTPVAYPGFAALLARFREEGGLIVVDSHSYSWNIERDYRANGLPMPDVIYGWDLPPAQRKPSPYTLFELMRRYDLAPSDILVVDDLRPGFEMASAAGVDFAAAGWAHHVPAIASFMKENATYFLPTVESLAGVLFEKES